MYGSKSILTNLFRNKSRVRSMDCSQGYAEGEGCLCVGQLAQIKMLKEIFTDSVKQGYVSDEEELAVYTAGIISFISFLKKVRLIQ